LTRGRLVGACAVLLALTACNPDAASTAGKTSAPATTEPATSAPATTSAPASATVPPVGTVLTALTNGGSVIADAAGQGFSVLLQNASGDSDSSTVTTYDVAGRALTSISASGRFTGSCGVADLVSGDKRIIVTETVTNTPAQGINPAQYSAALAAFDATSGQPLWTTQIVQPQGEQVSCGGSDGRLSAVQATTDGAWAAVLVNTGNLAASTAVDLRTGQTYPKADLQGALGKQLVTGGGRTGGSSGQLFVLALPPAWQGLGSFTSGTGPGFVSLDDPSDVRTGLFAQNSSGTGLSSDGSVLFAAQYARGSNGSDGTQLTAYSLPAMTQVWQQDTSGQSVRYTLLGAGGTTLVVQRDAADGTTTDGLEAGTGKALWTLPKVDQICGLSTKQMLVQANGQTAVLDLATGKQVSFSGPSAAAGYSSSCPQVLPGGIAVQNQTVVQVLEP
jgi:hypothetical protein